MQQLEYIVVSVDQWEDFCAVMSARGHQFTYSEEDTDDDIEYHIHSHLEEAEEILWAVQILDTNAAELTLAVAEMTHAS